MKIVKQTPRLWDNERLNAAVVTKAQNTQYVIVLDAQMTHFEKKNNGVC